MREVYSKIIEDAFEAGIENAWNFWDMTPAEINGRIKAFSEAQNRAVERLDMLAWMIGSYTAQGYHQPKKYPKKPDMIKAKTQLPDSPMGEENMKDILTTFAEIHNAVEGGK